MAPPTELFRGDGTAEKAHMWLRTLEGTLKFDAKDEEKIHRFKHALHPGGRAEEWWNGLGAPDKQDWTAVTTAFEKKWAKPKPSRRAQEVVINEIKTNYLDRDTLGQYIKDEDGTLVLSHIAWAEVHRKLLGELSNGDADMVLKSDVRGTLPVEFRQLIPDIGLDTWEKYLKAVEDISIERIHDTVEERAVRHRTADSDAYAWHRANSNASPAQRSLQSEEFAAKLMESLGLSDFARNLGSPQRTTRASPRSVPAARQSQPAHTSAPQTIPAAAPRSYQTPSTTSDYRTPWASRTSTDVFGGSTVRPPQNAFAKTLLASRQSPSSGRAPPTTLSGEPARDVDLARHILEHPLTYSNDAAGIQRYTTDLAAWTSQNGNSTSPDYTTFPFTPGTAAPGSRECFRCGVLTIPPHFGPRACTAQNGREVPQREQNVRRIVGAILYPPGQRTPSHVAQIQEAPYDLFGGLDPDQPLYEDADESENGEGPAV
ncbi:hypothetical protein B0H19DRAFT_483458 [Mycena capillaripes]|nr:hypothetical protein B0H19DRAFT_483458 [Mycena capillaripes]